MSEGGGPPFCKGREHGTASEGLLGYNEGFGIYSACDGSYGRLMIRASA